MRSVVCSLPFVRYATRPLPRGAAASGLVREGEGEGEGAAVQVLLRLGAGLNQVRQQVIQLLQ
jgi:hypothetical protein